MARRFSLQLALLLTFSLTIAPAAGQNLDLDDPEELGIVSGYGRMYVSTAIMDMMMSADSADMDALDDIDISMIAALGIAFDSSEMLDEHLDMFACEMLASLIDIDTDEGDACEMLAEEGVDFATIDDLGDQAIEATATLDADPILGIEGGVNILVVQDGTYLYLLVLIGPRAEMGTGHTFAEFLVNADPDDTDVVFDEDGASTGGFFDMLPPADDPIVSDYIPMIDLDMMAPTE